MYKGMKLRTNVFVAFAVLCLVTSAGGCTSVSSNSASLHSKNDLNYSREYYARTGSYSSEEKDLSECLLRAAAQVSIRKGVRVTYLVDGNRRTVSLDYNRNGSYTVLENMSVVEYFRDTDTTEAIVRMNSSDFRTPRISISDSKKDGLPVWITRPPSGRGFYAAVGSIAKTPNPGEAFEQSDMNAIGALAPLVANASVSGANRTYSAEMHGVYIARRWHDDKTDSYFSLAILPR